MRLLAPCLLLVATAVAAAPQYTVRLWDSASSGGIPSCSSTPLATFTAATDKCFGPIALGGSGGATVSYKLLNVSGSKTALQLNVSGSRTALQLSVYGGSACASPASSLGQDSGPTSAEGSCHGGAFRLASTSLSYSQSWRVRTAPPEEGGPPTLTGVIAGVVVGVVVLCAVAFLCCRRRMARGAPSPFGGGDMVVVGSNPIAQLQP